MSMNHLVGGRAFTLFGRTRKGGSVGIGRWTAFSLEAGRSTDLSNSSRRRYDYWSLWRKREGGERREKEKEKENRMGCRGGKDEGHARPSSRGRRSGVVVSKGVVARENILT